MKQSSAVVIFFMLMALVSFELFKADFAGAEDGEAGSMEHRLVTITAKNDAGIVADNTRYQVTETTEILNRLGIRSSLKQLDIPCQAVIYFETGSGDDPRLLQIDLQGAQSRGEDLPY